MSRRRRGGRGRWLAAGIVVLVLAAGAVTWWVVASGGDQPAAQPLATARAVRTTLTQTVDASFTLVKEKAEGR